MTRKKRKPRNPDMPQIKGVIDRFEGEQVVLEVTSEDGSRHMQDFHIGDFPEGIKEGDSLYLDDQGWHVDQAATKKLKQEIEGLMDDLFLD